ncbi:MAG: endonuclease/exonuclease/phosphatase family protein [Oscillospiraceae bacterium]
MLTLNTHSLIEENYSQKLEYFIQGIIQEKPDIIALQEVNQSINSNTINCCKLTNFYPCQSDVIIRNDNHVYNIVKKLHNYGIYYYWTWLPIKIGYSIYQEGMAILSLKPIVDIDVFLVSKINDYNNWKTRKILGVRVQGSSDWFYSVHLSWWNDLDEPFQSQWIKLNNHLKDREKVWIMGDFNNPSNVENEGYNMVSNSNWFDTYTIANEKDDGITVENLIDGWKEKLSKSTGMRIDQIWCNYEASIKSSKVIFNGRNRPIVSDHYGVLINTGN